MKSAYDLMRKMCEIDEEIQRLNIHLQNANTNDREWLEAKIDQKYSEFLDLKHKMEEVEIK